MDKQALTIELRRFFLTDPYCSMYHRAIDKEDWETVQEGLLSYSRNGTALQRTVARERAQELHLIMEGR